MEQKMASSTATDASRAMSQHYAAEGDIQDHVRNMTLAGKRKLAEKMAQHVKDAEAEAKQ